MLINFTMKQLKSIAPSSPCSLGYISKSNRSVVGGWDRKGRQEVGPVTMLDFNNDSWGSIAPPYSKSKEPSSLILKKKDRQFA